MGSRLEEFKRGSDYLICIDSDGCAMDTMDIKHYRCFGPCMVAEWGLEEWKDTLLARWNAINLYTGTRGINRYKALGMILREIDTNDRNFGRSIRITGKSPAWKPWRIGLRPQGSCPTRAWRMPSRQRRPAHLMPEAQKH